LEDTQILTIALSSIPATVAVVVGILVKDALLRKFWKHLDARFDELDGHLRSNVLKS